MGKKKEEFVWTRRAGAYGVLWLLVGFLGWAVFGAVVK